MMLSMEEVQKQHESTKKLYEQGLTVAPVDVKRVLDLYDTIEALQQENNGWRERYDELDAGHSRLFKDFCKLQQENEQLQAQVARVMEALRKARETISAWDRVNWFECDRCKNMRDALAAIDKVIGGKEDV